MPLTPHFLSMTHFYLVMILFFSWCQSSLNESAEVRSSLVSLDTGLMSLSYFIDRWRHLLTSHIQHTHVLTEVNTIITTSITFPFLPGASQVLLLICVTFPEGLVQVLEQIWWLCRASVVQNLAQVSGMPPCRVTSSDFYVSWHCVVFSVGIQSLGTPLTNSLSKLL